MRNLRALVFIFFMSLIAAGICYKLTESNGFPAISGYLAFFTSMLFLININYCHD